MPGVRGRGEHVPDLGLAKCPSFSVLYSFDGADGAEPYYGSLVQGVDGNLYGTTVSGGANGRGTVFKITPAGNLSTLYSFCAQSGCADGANPYAGLIQATDGNFYGTTFAGGANGSSGPNPFGTAGGVRALNPLCRKAPESSGG